MKKSQQGLIILALLLIISITYLCVNPIKGNKVISSKVNTFDKRIPYNETVEQTIEINNDYLSGLLVETYSVVSNINVLFEVEDEAGSIIYNNKITYIPEVGVTLYFKEPLINQSGKKINLRINVLDEDRAIHLSSDKNNNILVGQIIKENNYKLVKWLSILFLIVMIGISFLTNHNYKIENKYLKLFQIPLYIIYSYCTASLLLLILYKLEINNTISIKLFLPLIILLSLLVYVATQKLKHINKDYAKLFLIIAIPLSAFYTMMFMPNDGQDGFRHYARAYMIATNQKSNSGTVEIPEIISIERGSKTISKTLKKCTSPFDYNKVKKSDIAGYNSLFYIVPASAIYVIKTMNINPYIGWYCAKILNSIVSILICYLIIKKSSMFKLLMIAYILIPMNMYQFSSLSADIYINLSMLALLTFTLNRYKNPSTLSTIDYIVFGTLSYLLYSSKIVYFPMVLLFLYLIKDSLKLDSKYIPKTIILLITIILLGMINSGISLSKEINSEYLFASNDLSYVIKHPFQAMYVVINYAIYYTHEYVLNFIGYNFEWIRESVPQSYAFVYLIILSILALNSKEERFKRKEIVACILTFISVFALIVAVMYALEVRSSPVISFVWGVQGRYFYPVMILLLISLSNIKVLKENNNINKYCIIMLLLTHLLYIDGFMNFLVM